MAHSKPFRLYRASVEALEGRTLFNARVLSEAIVAPSLHAARRVDSQLLAIAEPAGPRLGAPEALNQNLLLKDAADRLGVRITARNPRGLLPRLRSLGFQPVATSNQRHLIEGFLPASSILLTQPLSAHGLLGVMPLYAPGTAAGAVHSQGDYVLEADRVRASLPAALNGSGITVGVISDSYNRQGGASAGVASGDLPAQVNMVLEGPSNGSDEGRAMVEIVRDIAPGAGIAFGSGFFGQAAFAQTIRDLANPSIGNAKVITDDVFYFEEPFFQDGLIAQVIDQVSAQGVSYYVLAGNLGSQAYASGFRTGADAVYSNTFFDFDAGPGVDTRQRLSLSPGQTIILNLQWDNPWYTSNGVSSDLNLFLMSGGADTVLASSNRNNLLTQEPSELLSYTNTTGATQAVDLAITQDGGVAPTQLKWVNYGANSYGTVNIVEFATNSPTVIPHSAAAGAVSIGAVPYHDQSQLESFSSIGPATVLFNADGTRKASAEVRQAPDLVAVDGIDTTFFGGDFEGNGRPNFFGTSAAAPHAAGVAALLRQYDSSLTPAQVALRLQSTATDLGSPGVDARSGHGLINAYRAIYGSPVPASLPLLDGFESGSLNAAWSTSSTGAGRKLVTSSGGPASGGRHLLLDSSLDGFSGRNEATLHLNAALATGDVVLSFDQKEFGDEDHPMPATFTGSGAYDGVAMSVDGVTWHRLISLTGDASTSSYKSFRFNLSAAAAASGLVLSSNTRVRFQQYDDGPIPNDGIAFDNIRVVTAGVTVTPRSGLQTTEGGGAASFSVVLDSAPEHNVTIPLSSSDTSEGTISKSLLTFTPSNWSQAQTVTVAGVSDDEEDGDQAYSIILGPVSSLDPAYHAIDPPDVEVTNAGRPTSPTSPPPPQSQSAGMKFNFQPAAAPVVPGYGVDSGAVFGSRDGLTYGWTTDHADAIVDRNVHGDQRLDTHLQVKQGSRWELAVPNGTYDIALSVGDAAEASTNNVWIEGVNLFAYVQLGAGSFQTRSTTVTVSDQRLTLGIGSQAGGLTRLNFIEVTPGATSPPVSPPPPPPAVSTPGELKVNFQPASAPGVGGYLIDSGSTYSWRNGQSYGWTSDHANAIFDRDASSDQRFDTHAQVKQGSRWELAVPSGYYTVTMAAGDTAGVSTNNIWVEGVNLYPYVSLAWGSVLTRSISVNVTDGRLTLGIGSQASGQTKIGFIEVAGAALSPPASPPPVSPPPTSPPPPVGQSPVKINFQPASSSAIPGYLMDAGQVFAGRNGESYGWNVDHSDSVFDRDVSSDQQLDTSLGVKQGGRWELAVANGTYSVIVTVGDASRSTSNNIWIEGVNLFNYANLAAGGHSTRTLTVNVSDGRLMLGIGSAASWSTYLNSIEVSRL